MKPTKNLRIINMRAQNTMILKAFEMHWPEGEHVVEVTGRNEQGKTTVVNLPMYALFGRGDLPDRFIRDGEHLANVELDLGSGNTVELTVRRQVSAAGGAKFVIESADGARYPSPQALADTLMHRRCIDPLSLDRMSGKDRRKAVLEVSEIGIDLDHHAAQRTKLEETRRDLARDLKAAKARLESTPQPPEDAPTQEVSMADALAALAAEEAKDRANADRAAKIQAAQNAAAIGKQRVEQLRKQLADAETMLAGDAAAIASALAIPVEDVNIESARAAVESVEGINATVRQVRAFCDLAREVGDKERAWQGAEDAIHDHDQAREDAMRAATFPVAGLGIGTDDITFDGIPWPQLADSRKVKIGLQFAASLAPVLKAIRIDRAESLDSASREVVRKFAEENDYYVLMASVEESGKIGLVIENGEVVADNRACADCEVLDATAEI